ncbi:hypothetical protein ACHAXR_008418 [Thalassiosira sp. AJA248-18]
MENNNTTTSNDGQRRGWGQRHQHQDEKEPSSKNLPSEQDRKAVMGCLAAVLNITFAARQRKEEGGESKTNNSAVGKNVGTAESDAAAADDDINFSIRQSDDDDDGNNSHNAAEPSRSIAAQQQNSALRRTKAFQRELLNISAELLFLSPEHAAVFLPNLDIQCADGDMEQDLLLRPFLDSLSSSEESFRCIALLMFRFLLLSGEEKAKEENSNSSSELGSSPSSALEKMTIVGYDSRVRYAFKYLAVSVLSFWESKEHDFMTPQATAAYATRKFEALEDGIALRLSNLSKIAMQEKNKSKGGGGGGKLAGQKKQSSVGQHAIRGLKIGAAGVAAGTLFAITGGLAAPAIVAGIAAVTGGTASVLATILLLPAATTIFGLGGGTLVASKMSKRTAGLTEFEIEKINPDSLDDDSDGKKKSNICDNPELSRTVCISGWLRDEHDVERPFGISPRTLTDRHELLCRYCSVYAPHIIPDCRRILKEWQGKEDELWSMCKTSYGKDPNSLLPFGAGPRYEAMLTERENAVVDDLTHAMGLPYPTQNNTAPPKSQEVGKLPPTVNLLSDVLSSSTEDKVKEKITDVMLRSYKAWDFQSEFGSELYVLRWEKDLLLDLNGSAKEFQRDIAKTATKEALKKTVMASLMAAVAVPAAILSLSNIIDEKWTLVAERSDEAGILLAQSLLNSSAGRRPVSLIGFSFGARVIVACLKELARNQAIWEQQHVGQSEEENTHNQSMTASLRKSIRNISNRPKQTPIHFSREPASIIEDIVIMGCPASVNSSTWLSCRGIVGGRLINCYSRNDMILALMYRLKNVSQIMTPPVGISDVNVQGIENYDVSEFVASHGEYCVAVHDIINLVGYNQPAKLNP